jgi:hypothetical protein
MCNVGELRELKEFKCMCKTCSGHLPGQDSGACQVRNFLQDGEAAEYLARASFTSGSLCPETPKRAGGCLQNPVMIWRGSTRLHVRRGVHQHA